jgi:hypothetical protein
MNETTRFFKSLNILVYFTANIYYMKLIKLDLVIIKTINKNNCVQSSNKKHTFFKEQKKFLDTKPVNHSYLLCRIESTYFYLQSQTQNYLH